MKSKYHDEANELRRRLKARGIFLIVFAGEKGNGCCAPVTDTLLLAALPELLRSIADGIEANPTGAGVTLEILDTC